MAKIRYNKPIPRDFVLDETSSCEVWINYVGEGRGEDEYVGFCLNARCWGVAGCRHMGTLMHVFKRSTNHDKYSKRNDDELGHRCRMCGGRVEFSPEHGYFFHAIKNEDRNAFCSKVPFEAINFSDLVDELFGGNDRFVRPQDVAWYIAFSLDPTCRWDDERAARSTYVLNELASEINPRIQAGRRRPAEPQIHHTTPKPRPRVEAEPEPEPPIGRVAFSDTWAPETGPVTPTRVALFAPIKARDDDGRLAKHAERLAAVAGLLETRTRDVTSIRFDGEDDSDG